MIGPNGAGKTSLLKSMSGILAGNWRNIFVKCFKIRKEICFLFTVEQYLNQSYSREEAVSEEKVKIIYNV